MRNRHTPTQGRRAAISQLQISKVGFPIRKFTDQSLFAAPHDLSQRTTSFIASQRQGIHRIPLRHLIALITNAHRSAATTHPTGECKHPPAVRGIVKASISSKDQFCFKHIRELCGQAKPTTEMLAEPRGWKPHNPLTECVSSLRCQTERDARGAPAQLVFRRTAGPGDDAVWWSQTGSNRRPHACKARALPTELWPRDSANPMNGGPGRT